MECTEDNYNVMLVDQQIVIAAHLHPKLLVSFPRIPTPEL